MKERPMRKIVDGKVYNTETATLVADDVYWDGHNMEMEPDARNSWLCRTKKGAWFVVTRSLWQGEQARLGPIDEAEAQRLYEGPLSEHYLEWEEAFGREPEEPEPGRPPLYGETMRQTGVYLRADQLDWLRAQAEARSQTMAAVLRDIVDDAMAVAR